MMRLLPLLLAISASAQPAPKSFDIYGPPRPGWVEYVTLRGVRNVPTPLTLHPMYETNRVTKRGLESYSSNSVSKVVVAIVHGEADAVCSPDVVGVIKAGDIFNYTPHRFDMAWNESDTYMSMDPVTYEYHRYINAGTFRDLGEFDLLSYPFHNLRITNAGPVTVQTTTNFAQWIPCAELTGPTNWICDFRIGEPMRFWRVIQLAKSLTNTAGSKEGKL